MSHPKPWGLPAADEPEGHGTNGYDSGMGYPTPPWPPPPGVQPWPPAWQPLPPPPRNAADVTISILLMIMTVLVGGVGAVMGLMSVAFLDYCPPESCSVNGAVTTAMMTVGIAALIVLTGVILTISRLVARKPGWPFALGTLAACLGVFFLGAVAYTAVVG